LQIIGFEGPSNWQIVNLLGRVVVKGLLQNDNILNTSELPEGSYLLQIEGHPSKPFVKTY